jgi:hypothetical protein
LKSMAFGSYSESLFSAFTPATTPVYSISGRDAGTPRPWPQ